MFFISPRIVAWCDFFLFPKCHCLNSLVDSTAVARCSFSLQWWVPRARGDLLMTLGNPENVELVPSGVMKCGRTPLFFTVEKHEIIATLARVIIHLTVKLPLCFTVCYMPFLCASVLCILQLTVWKEKEAIYQNCAFLPASSVLFLLLGWCLFHIACGHIGKCQCIKFYCLIVHKRPWEKNDSTYVVINHPYLWV